MLSLKQNEHQGSGKCKISSTRFHQYGQFDLADFKCYTHPLEQTLFGIKHFITYVKSYLSPHASKKTLN